MTNMRLFVATLALLASASAYAPSQRSARRPTRMAAEVVDRRAALSAAVSGAVALGALGALEAAYARFTKAYVPVNPFGDSVGVDAGQGCATGCDYDWKARTPKGTLFIF